MFDEDQYSPTLNYSVNWQAGAIRRGNMVAMTEVGTNVKPNWSTKPPVTYQNQNNLLRVEVFRRAVRLVNASTLFPTGPSPNLQCNNIPLGLTVVAENPIYVFGNYNAPAGVGIDTDTFPGLNVVPVNGTATSPANYNGQSFANCGNNCHVPSAIVADAITLLSGACVGTFNINWSGNTGFAGWLDARSFVSPYQALAYRSARNTVYRFAMVSGYTSSWYNPFWGNSPADQGPTLDHSSGAINNFPRFLEDWRQNNTVEKYATYSGSLIRLYKSRQANGAFKRDVYQNVIAAVSNPPNQVEYVYRPPNRDWIFDLDFDTPCTLPPGSPFLQLIDFKGFQQSSIQR